MRAIPSAAVIRFVFLTLVAAVGAPAVAQGSTILYTNTFESPVGFSDTTGRDVSQQSVNALYGLPGFLFQQINTVETLENNGGVAFGLGYSDPEARGGNHSIGMLCCVQDDRLSLTFDVGAFDFLNVFLDISAIDLDGVGGPFGVAQPSFRLSLYDSPGGVFNINAPGTLLSQVTVTGTGIPHQRIYDWTAVIGALNASASTDGKVSLVVDLLTSGYAAFDNLRVEADDVAATAVPEPATLALMGAGLAGLSRRRRGARR
jgi:hypothetical protein